MYTQARVHILEYKKSLWSNDLPLPSLEEYHKGAVVCLDGIMALYSDVDRFCQYKMELLPW
ncbi:hypothetical protein CBU01nite_37920 [Clostridium butyricum]|nr:hypothetical protein CBU01nite_37920 [Clostridium butyricum]